LSWLRGNEEASRQPSKGARQRTSNNAIKEVNKQRNR
jgi:hypothetical protein